MATETEVKIKVDSSKLEQITAFLGKPEYFTQTNIIYSNGKGILRLRAEKGNTVVTYKGPRMNDEFGSREEIEVSFEGDEKFHSLRLMLEKIGLTETLCYNKNRAEFDFRHCKICLDSTSKGDFIEIEAKYSKDIKKAMAFFNLNTRDIEKRSYLELLGCTGDDAKKGFDCSRGT